MKKQDSYFLQRYIKLTNWIFDYTYNWLSFSMINIYRLASTLNIGTSYLARMFGLADKSDTNASAMLMYRAYYTMAPKPYQFDPREYTWAKNFLSKSQMEWVKTVEVNRLRILPPVLRMIYLSYYCRAFYSQKFIDDHIKKGCKQVILIGAGYDTSAYRNFYHKQCKFIEIDLPDLQKEKVKRVKEIVKEQYDNYEQSDENFTLLFEEFFDQSDLASEKRIFYLACDLEKDNLTDCLESVTDSALKTIAIFVGVSYYLKIEVVYNTLALLHEQFSDLHIFFDYLETPKTKSSYWNYIKSISKSMNSELITYMDGIETNISKLGFKIVNSYSRKDLIEQWSEIDYFEPLFYNYPNCLNSVPDLPCIEMTKT